MKINLNCQCPNTKCMNHGKCKDCKEAHLKKDTPNYCERTKIEPKE